MFVKTTNGQPSKYPYTLGELRRENAHTSFPKVIPEVTLSQYGVYRVEPAQAPYFDNKTHRIADSVESIDGLWTQRWAVTRLPEDRASANVRKHRDNLLSKTDWVVIMHTEQGASIPAVWETYRQALRDITDHENFPNLDDADWPAKPS
jgi:hypothetical protein